MLAQNGLKFNNTYKSMENANVGEKFDVHWLEVVITP